MTPEERIAQLEAQMAELLQRLNSTSTVAGVGSHLAVEKATLNSLDVNGIINGYNTRPIREQLVHRRILFGFAGSGPLVYDHEWTDVLGLCNSVFNGIGISPQEKALNSRFRFYAIYHDVMDSSDLTAETEIQLHIDNVEEPISFTLPRSHGDLSGNREQFSKWFDGRGPGGHGYLKIRTNRDKKQGVLYYLELQIFDLF